MQLLAFIALVGLALLNGSAAVYYGDGPKATHYGDLNGDGATDGGACLWGNVRPVFGVNTFAGGNAIFNNREGCGLCFDVQCDSSRDDWRAQLQPGPDCIAGASVRVYLTNQCPECEATHFDLSYPAWKQIGNDRAGILPIIATPCGKVDRNGNSVSGAGDSFRATVSTSAPDTPAPTQPAPTPRSHSTAPTQPPPTPSPTQPAPTQPPPTPSPTQPAPTQPASTQPPPHRARPPHPLPPHPPQQTTPPLSPPRPSRSGLLRLRPRM